MPNSCVMFPNNGDLISLTRRRVNEQSEDNLVQFFDSIGV
jgi:hypothetical protein